LVYYAETAYITEAIAREKEIKGWVRNKKLEMIEEFNPSWEDLGAEWFTHPLDEAGLGDEGRDSSLRSE